MEIPAHDISGIWSIAATLHSTSTAPMTPAAQAKFDSNTAEAKAGKTITSDPAFQCLPPGVPRIFQFGTWPFEIVQSGNRIFFFHENVHTYRTIWMDGRKMPEDIDVDPAWLGYSVGHWDGNDLVVETAHFNDKTWLDPLGHPHSDALRVTERFHRADYNNLTLEVTIEDPKFYTKTWTMASAYKLKPTWELAESFCIPEEQMKVFKDSGQKGAGPGH